MFALGPQGSSLLQQHQCHSQLEARAPLLSEPVLQLLIEFNLAIYLCPKRTCHVQVCSASIGALSSKVAAGIAA